MYHFCQSYIMQPGWVSVLWQRNEAAEAKKNKIIHDLAVSMIETTTTSEFAVTNESRPISSDENATIHNSDFVY